MRKGIVAGALAMGAALAMAGLAFAQAPADAIKARQANFKDIGAQNKVIGDQLKLGAPDTAAIKAAAAKIKAHAAVLPTWFPAGSGVSAGKTAAKAEIWSDAAGFAAASKSFQDAAAKLDQLAQAGDIEGLKGQLRPLGMTCGGCHNKYREKPQ